MSSWQKLSTKDKKEVVRDLVSKDSKRIRLEESNFIGFERVMIFNEKLNFMKCLKCKKIFQFNDSKEIFSEIYSNMINNNI